MATQVQAAPISWGAPFDILSASDIDSSFGRLKEAVNFTDTDQQFDQLVNTGTEMINFVWRNADHPSLSHSSLQGTPAGTLNDSDGSFYSIATGDPGLDQVLRGQVWTGQPASTLDVIEQRQIVITLSDLVPGLDYQLQVLGPADTRSCCIERTVDADDLLGNTARLSRGPSDFSVDPPVIRAGNSVIGTFTADADTQQFAMTGVLATTSNDPGIDGYVLRVIPEPSGALLAALGLGLVGLSSGRRRALW